MRLAVGRRSLGDDPLVRRLHTRGRSPTVKLETELKVRALKLVFPGAPEKFVPEVFAFEQRLNKLTEGKDQESFESWQDEPASGLSDAQARLFGLLPRPIGARKPLWAKKRLT
jgi:hypothetical protein